MKNLLLVIAFVLGFISLDAAEPSIKFYLNDGSYKQYTISDIEKMSFQSIEKGTKILIYMTDSTRKCLSPTEMDNITFRENGSKLPQIVFNFKNNNLNYELGMIDSICFTSFTGSEAKIDTIQYNNSTIYYLFSAYQDSCKKAFDKFNINVSLSGTQLLFLFDDKQQLRGLTLSVIKNDEPAIMTIDAKSTAYSLLMMTPGILTTDPVETEMTLNNINALSSLPVFIEYLKNNLPNKTLTGLYEETEFTDLLTNCIMEYSNSYKSLCFNGKKGNNDQMLSEPDLFNVDTKFENSKWIVNLTNNQWRRVNVYRRDLDIKNNELSVVSVEQSMGGATSLSWGSILTGQAGQPTIETDEAYNPESNVFKSEYWIIGMGRNFAKNDIPPTNINIDYIDTYGRTSFDYLVCPLFDLVAAMPVTPEKAKLAWTGIRSGIEVSKIFKKDLDLKKCLIECANLTTTMIKLGLEKGVFTYYDLLTAKQAKNLAFIITLPSFLISAANVTLFVNKFMSYPEYTKIDIINPEYKHLIPKITNILSNNNSIAQAKVYTPITIKGSNFGELQGKGFISFGGFKTDEKTKIDWSDTEISLEIPAGSQSGEIKVTSARNLESEPFDFKIIPHIYQISPDPVKIGEEISIRGTGFGKENDTRYIIFNSTYIDKDLIWSQYDDVKFIAPTDIVSGKMSVIVNGLKSEEKEYLVKPEIEEITPQTAKSGDEITITGRGFGNDQNPNPHYVEFGFKKVLTYTKWSHSEIKLIVPPNLSSWKVSVTVNGQISNSIDYTIKPHIKSFSPQSGSYGESIIIEGSGFGDEKGTSSVHFGNILVTEYPDNIWTDTKIVVKVPFGASTSNVYVTVNNQKSDGKDFKVKPKITEPYPGPAKIGDEITIAGTGFGTDINKVSFTGADASSITSWTNTRIKVIVPTGATSGKLSVTVNHQKSNEIDFTVSLPVIYESVTIGTQIWMVKNLDVTTYRNGDVIPQVTDSAEWANMTTGAWCYYNNDPSNNATYGKLYNGYAVRDPRGLAPEGWHIPSKVEWLTPINYLGGESVAGGKMKESGYTHWDSPNEGATNESGFTALPGGWRGPGDYPGGFIWLNRSAAFWMKEKADWDSELCIGFNFNSAAFWMSNAPRFLGYSVRCIKD